MSDEQDPEVQEKLEELTAETKQDAAASQILCEYLEARSNSRNPDEVDVRTFLRRAPSQQVRDRAAANIKTYWACLELSERLRERREIKGADAGEASAQGTRSQW